MRYRQFWTSALAGLLAFGAAQQGFAQSVAVHIDSSFADYLLAKTCSGAEIDEAAVRAMPVVQSQVKHHANLSAARDMDAFVAGLKAAARCETPEVDPYLFNAVVTDTQKFKDAIAFYKDKAPEIEAYVSESLAPFAPPNLNYEGELVLSIVGNNCGGFSMDGRFYLALNCLRDSFEQEFSAAKVISAHETYHAVQYAFFHPFDEDIARVKTRADAFDYMFMNLILEGTAEFVADSRAVEGEGLLTDLLKRFARNGYRQAAFHIRQFGYMADILNGADDDLDRRVADAYSINFGGQNRQVAYYAGAEMARHIDETMGRAALICILGKPPEQFIRAYQDAASERQSDKFPLLPDAMMKAANRLSDSRHRDLRYEHCAD